jgi:2-iminoacetate synthase
MTLLPDMEPGDPAVMRAVLEGAAAYEPLAYSADDAQKALRAAARGDTLSPADLGALLAPAAAPLLEDAARLAQQVTRARFGNAVGIFTPLYLSNYCANGCRYCGFSRNNPIKRARLSLEEAEAELRAIAATGLEEILLLTGESPDAAGLDYIAAACRLAREHFRVVGLEVYPMNSADYAVLRESGADFVTVFQETYDPALYATVHPSGRKRVFPYRFYAQERALRAGMRGAGFGSLLGLGPFRRDVLAVALHARLTQRQYPHAELSFSVPRLRPIINNDDLKPEGVSEAELCQVICALRLFMPFAGITVSTRESPRFRDHAVLWGATKVSAGVDVGIGGHGGAGERAGDGQFEISDRRSLAEMRAMLLARGLQPVLSDHSYV